MRELGPNAGAEESPVSEPQPALSPRRRSTGLNTPLSLPADFLPCQSEGAWNEPGAGSGVTSGSTSRAEKKASTASPRTAASNGTTLPPAVPGPAPEGGRLETLVVGMGARRGVAVAADTCENGALVGVAVGGCGLPVGVPVADSTAGANVAEAVGGRVAVGAAGVCVAAWLIRDVGVAEGVELAVGVRVGVDVFVEVAVPVRGGAVVVGVPVRVGVSVGRVPVGVTVGVPVRAGVLVGVLVDVAVRVSVLVGVPVRPGVLVGVLVDVAVRVSVLVGVRVAVLVDVLVDVGVLVAVLVGVRVPVLVDVGVLVEVLVGVRVGVRVPVLVDVGVLVAVLVGVLVDVGVPVAAGRGELVAVGVNVRVAVGVKVRVEVGVKVRVAVGVAATQLIVSVSLDLRKACVGCPLVNGWK
jgi:hypothetical protein